MTEALDYALDYARAGFAVFPVWGIEQPAPLDVVHRWRTGELKKKEAVLHARCACGNPACESPGKHPKLSQTQATTDERTLRTWFQDDLTHVGIMMPAGHVALDFDTYEPGTEEKLSALRLQRVHTLEQQSGAGGVHLIFRDVPASVQFGSTLDSEPGVDLIHAGHRYLVAAPSKHWTGQRYRWANEEEPAALPPTLLERVKRGAKPTRPRVRRVDVGPTEPVMMPLDFDGEPLDWAVELAGRVLPPAISNDEPGSEEHGHVTLARAACHLIAGLELDEDTALEVLWEEYNDRCVPPWSGEEYDDFERTVRGAGKHSEVSGYLIVREDVKGMAERAKERQAQREEQSKQTRKVDRARREAPRTSEAPADAGAWDALPLERFDPNVEPPPIPYLWSVFGPGKVSAIASYPGASKTPFALAMAVAVASGTAGPDGLVAERARVLYIATEGARNARRKAQRIARAKGTSLAELTEWLEITAAPSGMLDTERTEALCDLCHSEGFGLVVIDTYGSALDGSIDRNTNAFSDVLKQLGDYSDASGVTFVVLLHMRKSQRNSGAPSLQDVDGHNSVAGALQAAVALWRPDNAREFQIEVMSLRSADESFASYQVLWTDTAFAGTTGEGARLAKEGHDLQRWGLTPALVSEDERVGDAADVSAGQLESQRRVVAQAAIDLLYETHAVELVEGEFANGGLGLSKNATIELMRELARSGVLTCRRQAGKGARAARYYGLVRPLDDSGRKRLQQACLGWGVRYPEKRS